MEIKFNDILRVTRFCYHGAHYLRLSNSYLFHKAPCGLIVNILCRAWINEDFFKFQCKRLVNNGFELSRYLINISMAMFR